MKPLKLVLGLCLFVSVLFSVLLLPLNAKETQDRLTLMKKEKLRITKLKRQASKRKCSPAVVQKGFYGPIIEANKKQYAKNKRLAESFTEKGDEIARRDREKAEKYYQLAQIMEHYAKQNRRIVEAYSKGALHEIAEAFGEIKKAEEKALKLTGKTLPRAWFMPEELKSVTLPSEDR